MRLPRRDRLGGRGCGARFARPGLNDSDRVRLAQLADAFGESLAGDYRDIAQKIHQSARFNRQRHDDKHIAAQVGVAFRGVPRVFSNGLQLVLRRFANQIAEQVTEDH